MRRNEKQTAANVWALARAIDDCDNSIRDTSADAMLIAASNIIAARILAGAQNTTNEILGDISTHGIG